MKVYDYPWFWLCVLFVVGGCVVSILLRPEKKTK